MLLGLSEMVGAAAADVEVEVVPLPDVVVSPVVPAVVAVTDIENGARLATLAPSLTEMTMFVYVPALAFEGVPVSAPVEMLKLAHAGLFEMEKASVEVADLTTGAKA